MNPLDARGNEAIENGLQGLSDEEAARRVRAGQANDWEPEPTASIFWIVFSNLFIIFNLMIFPLLAVLLALGQYKDVVSVGGIALLNTAINILQEIRAKCALDRIRMEHPATTRVVRGGKEMDVPARTVVRGDLLVLGAGARVVADGPVVQSEYLELDESMLTGESEYVGKDPGDRVLAGSFAVAGAGLYLAEKLGPDAWIQSVVRDSRKHCDRRTEIERRVDVLVRACMVLCFLVSALLLAVHNPLASGLVDPVRFIVASVTSLIPQGLVLIVTVAFALGVIAFARKGIIFRRMNAVEGLAGIDLICMDKTGTLTHNEIQLEQVVACDSVVCSGTVLKEDGIHSLLSAFAAGVSARNKTIEAVACALPADSQWKKVSEIPFKSKNKFSAVRVEGCNGETWDVVLGAAEMLAPRLSSGNVPDTVAGQIRDAEAKGLRTVLGAVRKAGQDALGEHTLDSLIPACLVVFSERIKEEAPAILDGFARRGVRQVVISGDSLVTVQSLARKIGLSGADAGVSGQELSALASHQDGGRAFRERVLASNVFARVLPEQKKAIIRTFRDGGYHVAMVGDGVNDVLALKESELAIAMGSGGSMAKDVADIVLVDNRFDLLPGLLEEGEKIVSRIRDAARIFTLKNAYALILIVSTIVFGLNFPFYPQQITMINFVTITIPLLYMVKFSQQRSRVEGGFLGNILKFSLWTGGLVAGASLAVNFMLSPEYPPFSIREMLGIAHAFGSYLPNPSHLVQTAGIIPVVVIGSLAFVVLMVQPGRVRDLMRCSAQTMVPIGLSMVLILLFFGVMHTQVLADFFEFVPLRGSVLRDVTMVTLPTAIMSWFVLKKLVGRRVRTVL